MELSASTRPRERLERLGVESLSEEELLALVLRTGWAGEDVLALAGRTLRTFPEGPARAGFARLRGLKGLGDASAAAVLAAYELGRRAAGARDTRPVLDSPERVVHQVPSEVREGRKERFVAFYLNARSQLLYSEVVSVGTLSASLVHPREVFAPALEHAAAAIVVAHNHPSGDTTPSAEDKDATRRLCRAGELMGIPVLDHLIVAESGFYSFKENGLLS